MIHPKAIFAFLNLATTGKCQLFCNRQNIHLTISWFHHLHNKIWSFVHLHKVFFQKVSIHYPPINKFLKIMKKIVLKKWIFAPNSTILHSSAKKIWIFTPKSVIKIWIFAPKFYHLTVLNDKDLNYYVKISINFLKFRAKISINSLNFRAKISINCLNFRAKVIIRYYISEKDLNFSAKKWDIAKLCLP